MKAARLVVGVSVLAAAGLGLVAATRASTKKAAAQTSAALPTSADSSLATVKVSAASSYAPTRIVLSGAVDYSHIGDGWSYSGTWGGR